MRLLPQGEQPMKRAMVRNLGGIVLGLLFRDPGTVQAAPPAAPAAPGRRALPAGRCQWRVASLIDASVRRRAFGDHWTLQRDSHQADPALPGARKCPGTSSAPAAAPNELRTKKPSDEKRRVEIEIFPSAPSANGASDGTAGQVPSSADRSWLPPPAPVFTIRF